MYCYNWHLLYDELDRCDRRQHCCHVLLWRQDCLSVHLNFVVTTRMSVVTTDGLVVTSLSSVVMTHLLLYTTAGFVRVTGTAVVATQIFLLTRLKFVSYKIFVSFCQELLSLQEFLSLQDFFVIITEISVVFRLEGMYYNRAFPITYYRRYFLSQSTWQTRRLAGKRWHERRHPRSQEPSRDPLVDRERTAAATNYLMQQSVHSTIMLVSMVKQNIKAARWSSLLQISFQHQGANGWGYLHA